MPTDVIALLEAQGQSLRRGRLARGALSWTAATLALWLAWFGLDNLLRLPTGLRLAMTAAGVAWPLGLAWRRLLRPAVWRTSPERTAREIETRFGMDDNVLIGACQFSRRDDWTGVAAGFVEQARRAGARRAAEAPCRTAGERVAFARRSVLAGALLTAWAVYAAIWSRHAGNAWQRFSRPLSDVPPVGDVAVTLQPHGETTVCEGESLTVRAHVTAPAGVSRVPLDVPVMRRTQRVGAAAAAVDLPMTAEPDAPGVFRCLFADVREPFECRAVAGETWSPALRVTVQRLPRVAGASFRVTAPSYVRQAPETRPGPPASVTALPGSTIDLRLELDRRVGAVAWRIGTNETALARDGAREWRGTARTDGPAEYSLAARETSSRGPARVFCRGNVLHLADEPPAVRFDTDDRNRLVWPGERLGVPVVASDDFGLHSIAVTCRRAAGGDTGCLVRAWSYQGPPGRAGEVHERLELEITADRFDPGETYLLEASARDWRPDGTSGRAEPLVLRVRRPQDAAGGSEAARAGDALQRAIEAQRQALGLARNLEVHLDEALQAGTLPRHRASLTDTQTRARLHAREARTSCADRGDSAAAERLRNLAEDEMGLVLSGIAGLDGDTVAPRVRNVSERQAYILNALLALLGRVHANAPAKATEAAGQPPPPAATDEQRGRDLAELVADFARGQRRVVDQSRSLLERGPDDLSEEEREILGQLAREEARWAQLLRDKVDDISRNPLQDFADGKLAKELNEIYEEVQTAAAELYARKIELAVPQEQAGLENATELLNNLERWLTDKPDYQKWLMEEPPQTPDAPLADLPSELEDIVGDLLDREENMTEEVEDVTSSWIDSLDKGAGWDAMDGPISSMSAKGVTGNQLPNQQEIGGRSGEGRTGRSQGQMVESAAEGKEGRPTPSRLTPTPFESASVEDRSSQSPGGATGGGKLSGFAGEGLRGPSPSPRLDRLQRLAGNQTAIRQDAERLSLHLRAYGVPTGDLDGAVRRMRDVEALANAGEGGRIRRAYDAALDGLREAREAVELEAATRRERGALPRQEAEALWAGLRDELPAGYEEIAAAYFRRLAEATRGGGAKE